MKRRLAAIMSADVVGYWRLIRADVEYPEQTRIEGEIQQLGIAHPVTELWQVFNGRVPGRQRNTQITLFDSVGFAIEDFSALRYVRDRIGEANAYFNFDLPADPCDPRDLFGMLRRAAQNTDSK